MEINILKNVAEAKNSIGLIMIILKVRPKKRKVR